MSFVLRFRLCFSPGGCNDIGAAPGSMGAHGSEGDGGCLCAGLTVRGSAYLVFDTLNNSHAIRRPLIESLNFPPTLAFSTGGASAIKIPTASMIAAELPVQIKLMTLTNNYAEFNGGQLLFRLAHIYSADEHPTLSQPVTVDLGKIFGKPGFTLQSATQMTVTGNQPRANWKPFPWPTMDPTGGKMYKANTAFETAIPYDAVTMTATLRPMEVQTFLVKLA